MADDWLGISSAELDSYCGDTSGGLIVDALDGTGYWYHAVNEVHWFIIDLGSTHTIEEVRGRSSTTGDPTDVNIYIDDNNPPTTLCEEGITTWRDTVDWVEIVLTTEGTGRYIKVEIEDTEHPINRISFGGTDPYYTIFDAYGSVPAPPPTGTTGDLGLALGLGPGGGRVGATGAGSRIPHLDPGLGMKRHPRSRVH